MWELRYLIGGRELHRSLDQHLVVGESFAFLRPGWDQTPLIASILQTLGVDEAPGRIFPLWGEDEIAVPGGVITQQAVPKLGFCSVWTDRDLYRELRDPIKVFIFDPLASEPRQHVSIWCDGKLLDQQHIHLDNMGICQLELNNLPAGRYRIVVGGDKAETHFVIAHARICTLEGNWLQCYAKPVDKHRNVLVFVIQLTSFDQAIQDDFQVQLYDEGRPHAIPLSYESCRSDGGGRIAGEILLEGAGPFSLEIQSYTDPAKWSLLEVPLEGTEAPYERAQLIGPLGPIHSWQWDQGRGTMGLRIEKHETTSTTPVSLETVVGQKATLRVNETIDQCTVLMLDPVRGEREEYKWPELYEGQTVSIPSPGPFGILCVGGFLGETPWEGWSLVIAPPTMQLDVDVEPRKHLQDPIQVQVTTQLPYEVPVYLIIKEDVESDETSPWGPAETLLDVADEMLPSMFLGNPNENITKATERLNIRPRIQQPTGPPKGAPPPRTPKPGTPPPSSSPPPSIPHPDDGFPMPEISTSSPKRMPPQSEDFPDVLVSQIVTVKGQQQFSFPSPGEYGDYRIEAVALTGTSWGYATAEVDLASPTFCELLIPPHAHADGSALGEAVIMTDQPYVYVELWRDQLPISMYNSNGPVSTQTPVEGPLAQLQFKVAPGHHVLRIVDAHGNPLDYVEAEVHPWGVAYEEGWGLRLLAAGDRWEAPDDSEGPVTDTLETEMDQLAHRAQQPPELELPQTMAIPHILPMLRQVAQELTKRPPEHCEAEAARITAALYLLPYAESIHQQSQLHQLIQVGVAQLREMFVPQRGFKLYIDQGDEPEWGMEALFHLWDITWMDHCMDAMKPGYGRLSGAAYQAPWREPLLNLMDEAAHAYNLQLIPIRVKSFRDACRVFLLESVDARREEALWEIQKKLVTMEDGSLQLPYDNQVIHRQEMCYAAVTMLASDSPEHKRTGLQLANQVLEAWSSEENSYSTKEGIALLALIEYTQRFLVASHHAYAVINGMETPGSELNQPQPVESIEVHQGLVPLGFYYPKLPRDLRHFEKPVQWELKLVKPSQPGLEAHEAELGDRLHLKLILPGPSEVGDILELYLPPCLAWLDGERHEKHFAVPIYPYQTIDLPLVAISTTQDLDGSAGIQHWGARLSNLYESERGRAAFQNSIVVWGRGQRKRDTQQQWLNRWRKIFG